MNAEAQTFKTGTTTMGIICKDGVVLAAEKKATMGYLIESKYAKKVYQLDDHIGLTIAGSVGDAQSFVRLLKAQFNLYKLERGPITLRAAATIASNILQGNKWFPYFNQFILGGFDGRGPQIYSIDMAGGYTETDKFYSTGSGSPYAYGVLEAEFKEGISTQDGVGLALKAAKAAIERDIGSGGKGFTVAIINADGYRELTESEIKQYLK